MQPEALLNGASPHPDFHYFSKPRRRGEDKR